MVKPTDKQELTDKHRREMDDLMVAMRRARGEAADNFKQYHAAGDHLNAFKSGQLALEFDRAICDPLSNECEVLGIMMNMPPYTSPKEDARRKEEYTALFSQLNLQRQPQ